MFNRLATAIKARLLLGSALRRANASPKFDFH
jgi:hypothetical protein